MPFIPYTWPPTSPTTMTAVIPSYQYDQYTDDPWTFAWFSEYNTVGQDYVDTVNDLNLPIYTGDIIAGALLDWVGAGIYGYTRPALSSTFGGSRGELNTYMLNTTMLNDRVVVVGPSSAVDDDVYKRCLTWHFFKGDGKYFTIRWLKRRVMRFLIGVNGTAPPIDQTYQISVTLGTNNEVTIRFIDQEIMVTKSSELNTFMLNTAMLNSLSFVIEPLTTLPFRQIFYDAVLSGALELPFQYTWTVVT
jgi:hypothetical protein